MENLQKTNICTTLRSYCDRYKDATKKNDQGINKAAASLKNVSPATISQMLSGNWDLITDEMWRNVASQVGHKDGKWSPVETTNFGMINRVLDEAKDNSLVLALTGDAGSGKTFSLNHYKETHSRVYLLCCNEYLNRKLFLTELLTALGRKDHTGTVGEMISEVVRCLSVQEAPLLILDEADKLSDQVLCFFVTLYNQLEDKCGIVLCATNFLEKRLRRGVKLNKRGYNEIWSRIGRKCIELKGVLTSDVVAICEANAITDKKMIDVVLGDSEGDLRRVKRKVYAILKQRANAA
jgi:DNA transposition AAA+ family ATPase